MKYLLYIIILSIVGLFFYNLGYDNNKPNDIIISKTDTIFKTDTITQIKLDTIYKTKVITKTLHTTDSVLVEVQVPIETSIYSDSSHYIQISGFQAVLDSFMCQGRETVIYNEKVVYREKEGHFLTFKPSLGVGYGLINKKPDLFVGMSLNFNF